MSPNRTIPTLACALAALIALRWVVSPGPEGADGPLGSFTVVALEFAAAALCLCAARSGPRGTRAAKLLLAIGIGGFATGTAVFFLFLDATYTEFPTASHYLWMFFYAAALVSLGVQARQALRRIRLAMWLDAAIVGLTFAAVVAQLSYDRAFREAVVDNQVVAGELSYTLLDVAWLGGFVALWVALGWKRLGGLRVAAAGMAVIALADSISMLEIAEEQYLAGTLLDSLWPAGFVLVAAASVLPASPVPSERRGPRAALLATAAMIVCLGILVVVVRGGGQIWAPVALCALLALAASVARVFYTLVDNERLFRDRDAALREARQSEERYLRVLETTTEGVWIVDQEDFTTFANSRMAEMLATTPELLLGKSLLDFTTGEGQAAVRAALSVDQQCGGHQGDLQLERADGGIIWARTSTSAITARDGTFEGAVMMVRDVTAARDAEQELRFQAGLLDHVDASLVAIDTQGVVTCWSRGAEELYGWSREEAIGRPARELIAPDRDAVVRAQWRRDMVASGALELDLELERKDGSRFDAETRSSLIRGRDGAILGSVSVSIDVTERKRAEADTRLLAAIVESSSAAMVSTDLGGVITSWNASAEVLYGWTAEAAVGLNVEDVLDSDIGSVERVLRRRVLDSDAEVEVTEARCRTTDGSLIDVSFNLSAIRDDAGTVTGVSSMAYDITPRRRPERNAAAQLAVASILASSTTVEDAVPRLLEGLGTALGFDTGAGFLVCDGAGPQRFSWARGDAPDATSDHLVARVPIASGDQRIGTLQFYADVPQPLHRDLSDTLVALGSQIGQFIRRRRAEIDLRLASDRLQAILDNTPAIVSVKDRDLRYVVANRELESVHGLGPGAAVGQRDTELFSAGLAEHLGEHDADVLEHGLIVEQELLVPREGGSTRTFAATKFPLRGADGRPYAVGTVAMDISDRKRDDEERRLNDERLAAAQRVARIGSWHLNLADTRVTWSDELHRILGREPSGPMSAAQRDAHFHPDDREAIAADVAAARGGTGGRSMRRALDKDGAVRYLESIYEPVFGDDGTVVAVRGTAQDVTERREAEIELATSRSRLAEAQRIAQVGSFVHDVRAGTMVWSDELYRIYGLPLSAPAPLPAELLEMSAPDDRDAFEALLGALPAGGAHELQHRIVRATGETRDLSSRCLVELGPDGRIAKVSGVSQDVTEAVAAERRARDSADDYRRIVETANEGVWLVDGEGRTTFVNARMAEMVGCTPEQVGGRPLLDFVAAGHQDAAVLDRRGQRPASSKAGDVKLVRADGSEFWAMFSVSTLTDREGGVIGALAMVANIDERVRTHQENERLQVELHQAQKLESVGQLAGGVAHDFNNLLSVILNYAEFAAEDVGDAPRLEEDLASIREAAERATDLTRQLLIFSRREQLAPAVVDLNEVVVQTERLLGRTIGEHIALRSQVADEALPVYADSGQLEQVLMNLVVNARDAIGDAGTITVTTTAEDVGEGEILDLEAGCHAKVEVADDGRGMPEHVTSRVFEPFYTTKHRGSGTGLGLATVYGIVKQSGGTVEIASEEGVGTTVAVYLPTTAIAASPSARSDGAESLEGVGERVLVVEDEEKVRKVTCRILANHGYEVLEASGPDAARSLWEEHDGGIDLVLTDVVMPGGSGKSLVDDLRRRRADVPCVYMSGYADEVLLRHGAGQDDVALLEKPFSQEKLLRAVGVALADGKHR